jgi:beta-RFAP synthase
MTRFRIRTPSRLHFGLLGWGPEAPRQFGGVGLMIDAPGLEFTAVPSSSWHAEGPLAARTLDVARRIADRFARRGLATPPARFEIHQAPPEHSGLGVGTQLSLAVARVLAAMSGLESVSIEDLADLSERGLRSGIGLHGNVHGGLIVDGGRRPSGGIPPLLVRQDFPPEWGILVVIPGPFRGLHGPAEIQAFAQLPPIPRTLTDRLCHLVLLGILPAVVERDLASFGRSVSELQEHVGNHFSPAQGGPYARPAVESVVRYLEDEGLSGVGQSSWGPAIYAFSEDSIERRELLLTRLRRRFGLGAEAAFWTSARSRGMTLTREVANGPS